MTDMNVFALIGRLVKDAELKYTASGAAIASFALASNARAKKGEEWVDEASFFDCTLFGKQAESLKAYLVKGKQVAISGRFKQDRWQDKDGGNRSKVILIAESIQLMGDGKPAAEAPKAAEPADTFPDDIPF